MKIRILAMVCAAVAVLAACNSKQETSVDTARAPSKQGTSEPASPQACVNAKGYDQLPRDLCMQQQYALRATRHYQDKQGNHRTRVSFAYNTSSPELLESMTSVLRSAKYRPRATTTRGDGSILAPFTKTGSGTTYLEIWPSSKDSASGGKFSLDYRDLAPVGSQVPAG